MTDTRALLDAGLVEHHAGRLDAAEAQYRAVLAAEPDNAEAHHLLGIVAFQSGRPDDACALFESAVAHAPGTAKYLGNLGAARIAAGRPGDAVEVLERSAALDPGAGEVLKNLGISLSESGRLEDAVDALRRAVEAAPDNASAGANLAITLLRLDRTDEALAAADAAAAADPQDSEGHVALGVVQGALGRHAEAIATFRRVVEMDPGNLDAWRNLGNQYRLTGALEDAAAALERAAEMAPGYADVRHKLAVTHLTLGRLAEGWRNYLARPGMTRERGLHREPLPPDLADMRVLVVRDQGLGDQIFFARYLPALSARGARLGFTPDARLAGMFARAGLAEILDDFTAAGQPFDLRVSLGDLPHLLGPDWAGATPPSIRLEPLPEKDAALRERLASFGPPPYVGVTWRAGTQGAYALSKEAPADRLAAALAPLDARIVALQRDPAEGEVAAFAAALGRDILDLSAHNADLEDMLALVGLLDEHVCVSNTNVHLAAARGRAVRVLVPMPPEFRWGAAGEESPWFPGMRLYRQETGGDWRNAFAALGRDLSGGGA